MATEATPREVRNWAHGKGYVPPARGPLPRNIVDAFNKAHRTKTYSPKYRPTQAEIEARG